MIVLIRHAEPEGAFKTAFGHTDLPLSETGRRQAQELGEALKNYRADHLFVSPLTRAKDTAAPLVENWLMTPEYRPDMKEIFLGEWEGLPFEQIRHLWPEDYERRGKDLTNFAAPGGESFLQLQQRTVPELERAAGFDGTSFMVCHAGVMRVLLCYALGIPLQKLFSFMPRHAYASVLTKGRNGWVLEAFNQSPAALAEYLGCGA